MDYVSYPALLRAVVDPIEADVIPALTDGYKASQLWAVTGLLGNIANDLERLPAPVQDGAVGDDLIALLHSAGLEHALQDGLGVADAAAYVREDLDRVIGGHSTLHYRRAIGGFQEST
jgi:hypothetical protein